MASSERKKMQPDVDVGAETQELDPLDQARAPQSVIDESYFEDTVESLRPGRSSAERVAAARGLGLLGSERATPHLIAAMFDDDPAVRSAAEEALNQISGQKARSETGVSPDAETAASSIAPTHDVPPELSARLVETQAAARIDEQTFESPAQLTSTLESEMSAVEEAQPVAVTAVSAGMVGLPPDDELSAEENTIHERLGSLEQQIAGVVSAIQEAENEIQWRVERENQLRSEIAARWLEEEELRKRADEEAQVRRAYEREAVMIEHEARLTAEAEVQRHAASEKDFRLQLVAIHSELANLARRRIEMEIARQESAEAAQRAEAISLRDEARFIHEAAIEAVRTEEGNLKRTAEDLRQQQEQLRVDIENLNEAIEQVARQRAEVHAARERADAENEEFARAQLRMREAERARAQAETERAAIEADLNQALETNRRQLEETRLRYQQESERLEEEIRLQAARERAHYEELQGMRARAEEESQRLAATEKEILADVDSLRIKDLDTRRRIEDAEAKRRATEETYRFIAEKVQRVEAEAHASAKEEEQMLSRLEAERRRVALEAQSRADQERRIREEIEVFRRLEAEERPRIEAATLQLADAEKRVQAQKARLEGIADAGVQAESDLRSVAHQRIASRPADSEDIPAGMPTVSPTISTYLHSVDPYKRAAAVAELARSNSADAFHKITECFDDHSPHVRNAAARALGKLEPERMVDLFNRALDEATPERKRNIGAAIAGSGLAAEAVNNLAGENREETFSALSILFVMAKTGEVAPLKNALEEHRDDEIGKAVSKLLTLSGHSSEANAGRESVAKASGGSEGGF